LFPEVLQIPLIMHFPRGVLDHQAIDPKAVALTTDITPTLYAALGYHPRRETPLVGQPLIAAAPEELATRRTETYVLAASYGAVYAVLRQNGRRLYVVDAVKDEEYGYERRALGRWSPVEVTPGLRAVNQRAIREYIDEISRVYHVNSGP
jgi:arylsulfatase A-like enzyme